MTGVVTEDEVLPVLRHFRPRPGFAASGPGCGLPSPLNPQRCVARNFSAVWYAIDDANDNTDGKSEGKLRVSYLHDGPGLPAMHIFLLFEITVATKQIVCVQCSAPDHAVELQLKACLDKRCKDLSSHGRSPTIGESTPSLFFVVSQLLQFLNDDFPSSPFNNTAKSSRNTCVYGEPLGLMVHRAAATAAEPTRTPAHVHRLIDLQTLLLRCAAAGRNRQQVCAPVPTEFVTSAAMSAKNGTVDALSHLVFAATNQLYAYGFREKQQAQKQPPACGEDEAARTLLSFLLSLPWTLGDYLVNETGDNDKIAKHAQSNHDKVPRTQPSKIKVEICLDIEKALGSHHPTFARHATAHGTVRAYHGTKIENVWSVLNHGLHNLSDHATLAQNGAMMGAGVYLSSSRGVAEAFAISAAERPPPTLAAAFQHEAFLRLLASAGVEVGAQDLDRYRITCFPVFEAVIIRPPRPHIMGSDSGEIGIAEKNGGSNHGGDAANITRQEGKYFVCTDGEFVRITKLHLAIELSERSDMSHFLSRSLIAFSLIVMFVAVYWATWSGSTY